MTNSPDNIVITPLQESHYGALVEIYNHYIINTAITFDIEPYTIATRAPWFAGFDGARHVCLVAEQDGLPVGYACSTQFRKKAAYDTSVEVSVYLDHQVHKRGLGSRLYTELFSHLSGQNVHRAYAGITMPNDASVAIHERFNFTECGRFTEVGYKFERYWDVLWLEKSL